MTKSRRYVWMMGSSSVTWAVLASCDTGLSPIVRVIQAGLALLHGFFCVEAQLLEDESITRRNRAILRQKR